MAVNLEAIKLRIEEGVAQQAREFFAGTEEHFTWLDEIVPSVRAMLAASFALQCATLGLISARRKESMAPVTMPKTPSQKSRAAGRRAAKARKPAV